MLFRSLDSSMEVVDSRIDAVKVGIASNASIPTDSIKTPLYDGNIKTCPRCKKEFSNKYNLQRHLESSKRPCLSSESISLKPVFQIHPVMEPDQKEFKCKYCHKIFKRKNNYYHHVKNTCNFTPGTVRKAYAVKKMRLDKKKKLNAKKELTTITTS